MSNSEQEYFEQPPADQPENLMPHSTVAEQSVIGAMMIDQNRADDVLAEITENEFYHHRHRIYFRAIRELRSRNQAIDIVSVCEYLQHNSNEAPDMAYLGEIAQHTPSAYNALTYAKIVKDHSVERSLVALASEINRTVFREGSTADKVEFVQSLFSNLESAEDDKPNHAYDVLRLCANIWEKKLNQNGELVGWSTGFADLDDLILGFQAPDSIVIAADSGRGKTTLAMNMVRAVAITQKKPTIVFSLEMSKEQLIDRMIASVAHIPLKAIKRGMALDEEYRDRVNHAARLIKESKLYIDDRANLTIYQIQSAARRFQREHGDCLVVVDYIQLVTGKGNNKEERVANVSKCTKQLAKELNIPVISLAQTNRNSLVRSDKRPQPSDIRDSAAIQHDCDILIMLYEPQNNPDGAMEIILRKHRNGELGTVYLHKRLDMNLFENMRDYEPQQESEDLTDFSYP